MELNKIYNENCFDTMARMPDDFVDLVVTSPPYDDLRDYEGYSFDFENIAKELYRTIKYGGVVVWVVGDATVNGSETGTSFKQALYFKEIGFRLHDTMIWNKKAFTAPCPSRYGNSFEYMFVLSKGKPKTTELIKDRKSIKGGDRMYSKKRFADGSLHFRSSHGKKQNIYGQRFNVWEIYACQSNTERTGHPAQFPEKLANDHITSWSNEGDLIYDPFCGSGTTPKVAMIKNRKYIASELSANYCKMANERINQSKGLFNSTD